MGTMDSVSHPRDETMDSKWNSGDGDRDGDMDDVFDVSQHPDWSVVVVDKFSDQMVNRKFVEANCSVVGVVNETIPASAYVDHPILRFDWKSLCTGFPVPSSLEKDVESNHHSA